MSVFVCLFVYTLVTLLRDMEYLRHYLQLFNQPEFIFLSNPCKDSWVCQSAALVTDDWVNEGSPYQCLCTILVIYNSAVKTVLQAFKYIALPPLEWNLTRVFLRHSDSFWWVSRLKLNHTWPEHGGLSRIFSHPTHIPPTAWLGALVWVSCVPKHSSPVKWLSVQFVMCPENQWPPLITQRCGRAGHCPSPVSPGPAGARRETGRAAVWAITGPGLFFFFFYNKSIKATARAHRLPQAFSAIWAFKRCFCRFIFMLVAGQVYLNDL